MSQSNIARSSDASTKSVRTVASNCIGAFVLCEFVLSGALVAWNLTAVDRRYQIEFLTVHAVIIQSIFVGSSAVVIAVRLHRIASRTRIAIGILALCMLGALFAFASVVAQAYWELGLKR